MKTTLLRALSGAALMLFSAAAQADHEGKGDREGPRADGHGPIGVMGDHTHKAGEWMVSYRFSRMDMGGNRIGTDEITPDEIVTTVPNVFFGQPGPAGLPETLRIVPTKMRMDMHMFGVMYAPTDWLTLMAMGMYMEKEMEHITFEGLAGTTRLGSFTTRSNGLGDTSVSALVGLLDTSNHALHVKAGLSLPTGSTDETDQVLLPNGATPVVRLPYPMQLGSGTFDALPGVTYRGHAGRVGWGAQYAGTIRLGENDEDYALGDRHEATLWASYLWFPWMSTSLRATGFTQNAIDGQDPAIAGPVQTANPAFQGGDTVEAGFGVNFLEVGNGKFAPGTTRVGVEAVMPVYQDLNGPQMERNWSVTAGIQWSF